MKLPFALRRLQASALNPLSPGYSGCGHCHRNWRICQSHSTRDKWQEWGDSDEEEWERIEEAVRRGL